METSPSSFSILGNMNAELPTGTLSSPQPEPGAGTPANPGKIIQINVYRLHSYNYRDNNCTLMELHPENTYISIFGPSQEQLLKYLLTNKNIKVIWQSPKAINKRPGHGTLGRNTVVVYEYSPDVPAPEKETPEKTVAMEVIYDGVATRIDYVPEL